MKLILFQFTGIILLPLFLLIQCEEEQNPVPVTTVNITIDMNDANYNDLVPGNYKYIIGGINGIILYRSNFDDFIALERTCPYEAVYGTRVYVDEENELYLECEECESRFYIGDGALTSGPSEFPLRTYNTSFDGRYLRIYN